MSLARASTPALVGLAALSLAVYAISERSLTPVHAEAFRKKLEAVRLMQRAERAIAEVKRERGITVDARNDPERTGVIGPQFTLITTDRGSQAAKSLAAHPNFAAAVTQMMLQAGVRRGDLVAVGMTGSLPGLNLAALASCRAVGAEPIIITSAGASMFGATDPNLTWLDMEAIAVQRGLWPFRSAAASLGGGGDVGRGLSPAGRVLLDDAIERNGVKLLDPPSVLEAVRQRVAIYDSIAAARGRAIRLYINVGGGVASLGGAQNGRLIPAGLTMRLTTRNYPNRGVINVMGERRIPVIHLLQVEKLARMFEITDRAANPVRPGSGLLFIQYRYNLWIVAAAALLVLLVNIYVLRRDVRQQVLGHPHPERIPPP
ncbi:MAG: poly-gamma-glutamate system protein [Candidatus Eisenbacteria bacterium]|nr:poly-gamma-glutamate system protein [Candidatus Eisenbacteria bacterium]